MLHLPHSGFLSTTAIFLCPQGGRRGEVRLHIYETKHPGHSCSIIFSGASVAIYNNQETMSVEKYSINNARSAPIAGAVLFCLPSRLFFFLRFFPFLSKIRGGRAPRAPPLDPPLQMYENVHPNLALVRILLFL